LVNFNVTTPNFFALYVITVRLDSNGVKLQVWKVESTLKSKYVINYF
jgi:hypothetical protein